MTARTLDLDTTTADFTPHQSWCPPAPRYEGSIYLPEDLQELAARRVRSYEAEDRRLMRLLNVTEAVTAAVHHAQGPEVGDMACGSLLGQLLLWSEVIGAGGHGDLGGGSRSTDRARWAQGLGAGRQQARDGQAWDEAIRGVATRASNMAITPKMGVDLEAITPFTGLDFEGEPVQFYVEAPSLGNIAKLREVLGVHHSRALAQRMALALAGYGVSEWETVAPEWAEFYARSQPQDAAFLYPGLYLDTSRGNRYWDEVITRLWEGDLPPVGEEVE